MVEIEKIIMQELKNQVEDDENEDEDGPPPGFQCIITPQPIPLEKVEVDENEDEDDGPPPGFDSIAPKSQQSLPSVVEKYIIKSNQYEDTEDDDGPPPGWENALPKADEKTERKQELNGTEDEDEGPPPGWETVLPNKTPPAVEPLSAISSEMSNKGDTRTRIKRASNGKQSSSPQPLPSATPQSSAPSASTEMAQLVCGTCRKLCIYPRGSKWVGCPSCREVNFVLEEHEVGQVKCGGCTSLLMYQYGAAAVQCSTCRTVTQIGDHNKRPPLSAQLAQRRQRSNGHRR